MFYNHKRRTGNWERKGLRAGKSRIICKEPLEIRMKLFLKCFKTKHKTSLAHHPSLSHYALQTHTHNRRLFMMAISHKLDELSRKWKNCVSSAFNNECKRLALKRGKSWNNYSIKEFFMMKCCNCNKLKFSVSRSH